MPQFLENALRKSAVKNGFKGKRADNYVFGAMNNLGAMKGNQETPKGAAMQAKHDRAAVAKGKISLAVRQGRMTHDAGEEAMAKY